MMQAGVLATGRPTGSALRVRRFRVRFRGTGLARRYVLTCSGSVEREYRGLGERRLMWR